MRVISALTLSVMMVSLVSGEALAQAPQEAAAVAPAAPSDAEVDRLVARIALYPDPLLVLVLQASITPLQVVEATRFLSAHATNPELQPAPGWDSSIVGLLNYPTVLAMMNDDLGWSQQLGIMVIDHLDQVQASIQQVRSEMQAVGVLVSNERQRVLVDEGIIRIEPAVANVIYVPNYAPPPSEAPAGTAAEAPAAAPLPSEPPAEAPAAEAAPSPPPVVADEATAEAPAASAAATAPTQSPAPEPVATTAYVEPSPAEAYAYSDPVAIPATPVYATAPAVSYSEPYPAFWSNAASFAGGAVIGGLLGYAIGDDDDDWDPDGWGFDDDWDPDDWDRGDINISDDDIIISDRDRANITRERQQRVEAELRQRRAGAGTATSGKADAARQRLSQASGGSVAATAARPRAPAATARDGVGGAAARPAAEPASRPAARAATPARAEAPARQAAPARQRAEAAARPAAQTKSGKPRVGDDRAATQRKSDFADVRPNREIQREAQRGAGSRQASQARAAAPKRAAEAAPARRSSGGDRRAFAGGGGNAQRDAARGERSRGGGRGERGR